MQLSEIKPAYDENLYQQIVSAFPNIDNPDLTPDQKGMIVWSHHNVANSQKDQKSTGTKEMRLYVIKMARVVILDAQKIKDSVLKSSMVKIVALNKDSLGEKELALEFIEQAIILDPDNADNHSARGIMLNRAGRFEEAKEELEIAIALAAGQIIPKDPGRFKHLRFMGNATRNLAISVKELGDIRLGITLTYQAEQLWLVSEEGGWKTETHRQGIAKMRAGWNELLQKKA